MKVNEPGRQKIKWIFSDSGLSIHGYILHNILMRIIKNEGE